MTRVSFSRFLFTLVFSFAPIAASARQGATISGSITDPDGAAIAGARVTLYSRDSAAQANVSTNEEGRYHFAGVAPGTYLIEANAEGFSGNSVEALDIEGSEHLEQELQLTVAGLSTSVVVTASSTPLTVQEVAKATDSVGREEISLRNEYSVAESLRLIPGFRVQQLGGPGGLTSIHVRGLRSYDTALLIDGIRMRDAADLQGSMNPFWEDLLVVNPERTEVMRGSGSSLYGSHAIGGVVNYVTDHGGGKPHGEFSAEGGGLGTVRGLGKVSGGALDNRLLYSGGITHFNVTGGLDGVNPYRNTSGQGFLRYSFAPGVSLSGRAILGDVYKRLSDSPYVDPLLESNLPVSGIATGVPLPDGQVRLIEQGRPWEPGNATYVTSLNDGDFNRAGSFANIAAIFTHQVSPGISYRGSYQFLDTDRRFDDGPAGVRFEPMFNNRSTFDGRVHLAQARGDLQAGRHQLISGGYEFEDESYRNFNSDENPDPAARVVNGTTISQRSHSLFAQDQVSLLNRSLQIALSGRVQKFSLERPTFTGGASPYAGNAVESPDAAWTGDAAILYLFRSTGTKWRAHGGNSYRAPSLFERYGTSFFFGAFSPFGDPRLRPERALSIDTGFDQWLANSRVKLSGTYFYTRLQETILFDFSGMIPPDDPFGRFGGYVNTNGGLARGVELSVNASPTAATAISASYTYTKSNDRTAWDFQRLVNRSLAIPNNVFTLLVSHWINRRFNVTFDMFLVGRYPMAFFTTSGTRAFDLDGWVKGDVTAKYVWPLSDTASVEFYGKADNLFNQKPYENGFRAPGVWATGGARFVF